MPVLDDFTGTGGTNLTAHTPSGGGSWAKGSAFSGDVVITDENRARLASNASQAAYLHSHTPASADYTAKATFFWKTAPGQQFPTLLARMDSTGQNGYMAQYDAGAVGWKLKRRVSGTDTQLGTTFVDAPGNGVARTVELDVQGDQISIKVDGVARCGSPITDNNITAVGKVGLVDFAGTAPSNSTGIHIDNVEIIEAGGGGGGSQWLYVAFRNNS